MYKFINENRIEKLGGFIKYQGRTYTNPLENDKLPKNLIKELGFKPLEEDEKPSFDVETQYLTFYYVEESEKIVKKWEVNDIVFEE